MMTPELFWLMQIRQLERGVDILVATPGRLTSFIERGRISLSRTKYCSQDPALLKCLAVPSLVLLLSRAVSSILDN